MLFDHGHEQHLSVGASHCHLRAHACEFSALTSHPWLCSAHRRLSAFSSFVRLRTGSWWLQLLWCMHNEPERTMAHLWPTKMHSSLAWRCPLQPIVPLYTFDPAAWASSLHGYSCGQESERQWKAKTVIVLPPPPAISAPQERALYLGLKSGPTSCVQMCGACVFRELSCCFVLKDELPSHLLKTLNDIGRSLERIHGFWQSAHEPSR